MKTFIKTIITLALLASATASASAFSDYYREPDLYVIDNYTDSFEDTSGQGVIYEAEFSLTAIDSDVYIKTTPGFDEPYDYTGRDDNRIMISVQNSHYNSTVFSSDFEANYYVTSSAARAGEYYVINQGATEEFYVYVRLENTHHVPYDTYTISVSNIAFTDSSSSNYFASIYTEPELKSAPFTFENGDKRPYVDIPQFIGTQVIEAGDKFEVIWTTHKNQHDDVHISIESDTAENYVLDEDAKDDGSATFRASHTLPTGNYDIIVSFYDGKVRLSDTFENGLRVVRKSSSEENDISIRSIDQKIYSGDTFPVYFKTKGNVDQLRLDATCDSSNVSVMDISDGFSNVDFCRSQYTVVADEWDAVMIQVKNYGYTNEEVKLRITAIGDDGNIYSDTEKFTISSIGTPPVTSTYSPSPKFVDVAQTASNEDIQELMIHILQQIINLQLQIQELLRNQ